MTILYILNSNKFSGAENVVITIINKMKDNNEVIYVSPNGPIKERLKENNIKYELVGKLSIKEIRRVIKKYNPDIIHSHDFTASILSSIFGKKVKVISHIHNNNSWIKRINIYSLMYLISTIRYKRILLVSHSILKEYIFGKFIKRKTEIVGNPIDIDKILRKSEEINIDESYDLAYLGRLSQEKQPEQFIKIVLELKKKIQNIKVVMIGDGPLKEKCQQMIKEYELSKNIVLKGFQKNPYVFLKKSKILCITSKVEGFGLAAVEGLALGKPVVASNVGGLPDIVNEKCGKITNNLRESVEEIERLLESNEYYKNKSDGALKKAQEMNNIDKYIMELEEIYKQCLEGE